MKNKFNISTFALISALSLSAAPAALAQNLASGWTGPWLGASIGMGSTNYQLNGSIDGFGALRLPDLGGQGGLATISAGYDVALSDRVTAGLMVDVSWTGIENSASLTVEPGILGPDAVIASYRLRPRATASVAARLGTLISDNTQVYGLVGYSQARYRARYSVESGGATAEGGYRWQQSGPVVGAGIETMVGHATSLRVEYRYHHLGRYDIFDVPPINVNTRSSIQTVQAGLSWRF